MKGTTQKGRQSARTAELLAADTDMVSLKGADGYPCDTKEAFSLALDTDEHIDSMPISERIQLLFDRMGAQKNVLCEIIRYCSQPKQAEDVNTIIKALHQSNYCVYSPASLCAALCRAGALEKQAEDGSVVPDDVIRAVKTVTIEGTEYYGIEKPLVLFWKSTDDGLAYLETISSSKQLKKLFEKDRAYCDIYREVLSACSVDEGASAKQLSDMIDKDERVQQPRLYSSYFVDNLRECGALRWDQAWKTTAEGKEGLSYLNSK